MCTTCGLSLTTVQHCYDLCQHLDAVESPAGERKFDEAQPRQTSRTELEMEGGAGGAAPAQGDVGAKPPPEGGPAAQPPAGGSGGLRLMKF